MIKNPNPLVKSEEPLINEIRKIQSDLTGRQKDHYNAGFTNLMGSIRDGILKASHNFQNDDFDFFLVVPTIFTADGHRVRSEGIVRRISAWSRDNGLEIQSSNIAKLKNNVFAGPWPAELANRFVNNRVDGVFGLYPNSFTRASKWLTREDILVERIQNQGTYQIRARNGLKMNNSTIYHITMKWGGS